MRLIEKKENLLKKLQDNFSLISSRIDRIVIYTNNNVLCIDVELELAYKKAENRIALKFIDVLEYSLYYNSSRYFYNVEIVKFFKTENTFYICFDPVNESEVVSEDDQDYIKAISVEGYYLS